MVCSCRPGHWHQRGRVRVLRASDLRPWRGCRGAACRTTAVAAEIAVQGRARPPADVGRPPGSMSIRPRQLQPKMQPRRGTTKAPAAERSGPSSALLGECGGYEIRTREGLPPTRFPSVRPRPLGESSAANNTRRWGVLANMIRGRGIGRGWRSIGVGVGSGVGFVCWVGDPLVWCAAPHVALSD